MAFVNYYGDAGYKKMCLAKEKEIFIDFSPRQPSVSGHGIFGWMRNATMGACERTVDASRSVANATLGAARSTASAVKETILLPIHVSGAYQKFGEVCERLIEFFAPLVQGFNIVKDFIVALIYKVRDTIWTAVSKMGFLATLLGDGFLFFCGMCMSLMSCIAVDELLSRMRGSCSVTIEVLRWCFIMTGSVMGFSLGVAAGTKIAEQSKKGMDALIRFMFPRNEAVDDRIRSTYAYGTGSGGLGPDVIGHGVESGVFSVVFLGLTSFLDVLVPWPIFTSIYETSVRARWFTSIIQGERAFREMCAHLCSALYDSACDKLGWDVPALQDLTVAIGYNLEQWFEEIAEEQMAVFGQDYNSVDHLVRLRSLYDVSSKLSRFIAGDKSRLSSGLVRRIIVARTELEKMYLEAIKAKTCESYRVCPFHVSLYGKPKQGKSTIFQKMANDLLTMRGEPHYQRFYARSGDDRFWSGYRQQSAVLIDDMGSVPRGDTTDESEMIHLVSCSPLLLNMADVESKGMPFTSKYIFSTTNNLGISSLVKMQTPDAFYRRRHVLVEVERSEVVEYDPTKPTANLLFSVRDAEQCPFPRKHDLCDMSYDEFLDYLLITSDAHFEEQNKLMASTVGHGSVVEDAMELKNTLKCLEPMASADPDYPATLINIGGGFCGFKVNGQPRFYNDIDEPVSVSCTPKEIEYLEKYDATVSPYETIRRLLDAPGMNTGRAIMMRLLNNVRYIGGRLTFTNDDDGALYENMNEIGKYLFARVVHSRDVYLERNRALRHKFSVRKLFTPEFWTDRLAKLPSAAKLFFGVMLFLLTGYGIYRYFHTTVDFIYQGAKMLWSNGVTASVGAIAGHAAGLYSDTDRTPHRKRKTTRNVRVVGHGEDPAEDIMGQYDDARLSALFDSTCVVIRSVKGNKEARGALLGGSKGLFVNHVLLGFANFESIKVVTAHATYDAVFQRSGIKKLPDSELATYEFGPRLPLQSSTQKYFNSEMLDHLESSQVSAHFVRADWNEEGNHFDLQITPLVVKRNTQRIHCEVAQYSFDFTDGIMYNVAMERGDCGALVIASWKGEPRIIGMHFAGPANPRSSFKYSFAATVPTRVFENERVVVGHSLQVEETKAIFPDSAGVRLEGRVPYEQAVMPQEKTDIVKSVIHGKLWREPLTAPSILTRRDQRIKFSGDPEFDPYMAGMKKYSQPGGPLGGTLEEEDDFHDALEEMCEQWVACAKREEVPLKLCSVDEALNGVEGVEYLDPIVHSTSEGYPYVLTRSGAESGKARLLAGEPGNWSLIPGSELENNLADIWETALTKVPCLVGIECAKDERVRLRKVTDNPKTRLFTVLPFHYNLAVRRLYLDFVRFLMTHRLDQPVRVGTNCHGVDWTILAKAHQTVGDLTFNGDYTSFDGSIPREVLDGISRMICKFYLHGHPSPSDDLVADNRRRHNLFMAVCDRYGLCGSLLFKVESGIPSGFPLTVIVDALANQVYLMWAWKRLARVSGNIAFKSWEMQKKFCVLSTYGDDNLGSVDTRVSEWYNLRNISKVLGEKHIILTDGSDKYAAVGELKKFSEVDFLKRKFVLHSSGFYMAPLDTVSIEERLFFIRKCDDPIQALHDNVQSAIMESFYHGEEYYRRLKLNIKDAYAAIQLDLPVIPSFRDLERSWIEGCSNIETHDAFESQYTILVGPEWAMENATPVPTKGFTMIVPRLAVVSRPSYDAGVPLSREEVYVVWAGCTVAGRSQGLFDLQVIGAGHGATHGIPPRKQLLDLARQAVRATQHDTRTIVVVSADGRLHSAIFALAVLYVGFCGFDHKTHHAELNQIAISLLGKRGDMVMNRHIAGW